MQTEWHTVLTLIRQQQSYVGLHCLPRLFCLNTCKPRHEKMCLRESPTRQDTNWPAQLERPARILKFRLYKLDVSFCLGSEQQRRWSDWDPRRLICTFVVCIWHKTHFLMAWLMWFILLLLWNLCWFLQFTVPGLLLASCWTWKKKQKKHMQQIQYPRITWKTTKYNCLKTK